LGDPAASIVRRSRMRSPGKTSSAGLTPSKAGTSWSG